MSQVSQFMSDLEKTMNNLDWHDLAQQTVSRALPYAETKIFTGKDMNYDRMGDAETEKDNGYGTEVKSNTIPVDIRQLSSDRFYSSATVDQEQVRRIMRDSGGDSMVGATGFAQRLARKCSEALNRRKDRVLLEAAFADVNTGSNFGTAVTFGNDGGLTIDATSGITYDTILTILANFQAYEVTNESNPRIAWFMTEEEMQDLMTISELINNDFITVADKQNDRLKSIEGMDLILYGSKMADPLLSVTSSVRDTLVLAQEGLCLGISKSLSIEVDKLPKTLETYIIKAWYTIGAVRTEGVRTQKIQTAAS